MQRSRKGAARRERKGGGDEKRDTHEVRILTQLCNFHSHSWPHLNRDGTKRERLMEMRLQGDSRLARIIMCGQMLNQRFFSNTDAADRDFPSSEGESYEKQIERDKFLVYPRTMSISKILYLWSLWSQWRFSRNKTKEYIFGLSRIICNDCFVTGVYQGTVRKQHRRVKSINYQSTFTHNLYSCNSHLPIQRACFQSKKKTFSEMRMLLWLNNFSVQFQYSVFNRARIMERRFKVIPYSWSIHSFALIIPSSQPVHHPVQEYLTGRRHWRTETRWFQIGSRDRTFFSTLVSLAVN